MAAQTATFAIMVLYIILDDCLKLLSDAIAFQGYSLHAIHKHWRHRHFSRARKADTDIGKLGLPRAINNTTHYRHAKRLDTRILGLPHWHLLTQVTLYLLR